MTQTKIIIENGRIHYPEEVKGFDETKKEYYLIKRDGLQVWDMDKYKVRPYIKDLLNRQNQFIEIKYLFLILIVGIITIFSIGVIFILLPGKGYIQTQIQISTDGINKKIDTLSTTLSKLSENAQKTNNEAGQIAEPEKPVIHYNIPTNAPKSNEFDGGL